MGCDDGMDEGYELGVFDGLALGFFDGGELTLGFNERYPVDGLEM